MPVASVVLAYLLGSVPFALLIARRWGAPDLRHVGSGNLGATNVLRASGVTAGVLVALLDIAKGAASVLLAERLNGSSATSAVAGSPRSSAMCTPSGSGSEAEKASRRPAEFSPRSHQWPCRRLFWCS